MKLLVLIHSRFQESAAIRGDPILLIIASHDVLDGLIFVFLPLTLKVPRGLISIIVHQENTIIIGAYEDLLALRNRTYCGNTDSIQFRNPFVVFWSPVHQLKA